MQDLEIHAQVSFKRLEILPLPCKYTVLLINFIANNQEYFQIQQYKVLIQGMHAIFTDQLLTFHAFRKA
jgi:hypothetical protein